MNAHGTAIKYGDHIDTDVIIPARYLATQNHAELASHCMEDIDKDFHSKIKPGDIMVAGLNFGCGSSREHAPIAIKASGISCVIAKTFARIFYRNAINIGLAILECEAASEGIDNGDEVEIDFDTGVITNLTKNETYQAEPFPEFIQNIIQKLIKILLYVVLVVGIVDILGVSMSSVIAILASCGLAVGLALQGALSNLAGGIMILVFKPFKTGDFIESAGAVGVVSDISFFYTTVTTVDNKRVLVPNGDLMNANVTNFSAEPNRRVDLDFKITNDIDANMVKGVLLGAASATPGVLQDPAPFARLTAVDDDTYIFTVRAWCLTGEYWDVYFDLIESCSRALRENGIDDPEERIAVRMVQE